MANYTHLLVALDLSDESRLLVEKANEFARLYNAKITLLNVVEQTWLYGPYVGIDVSHVINEVLEQANNRMSELSRQYQIPAERCVVSEGIPKVVINDYAEEEGVDLIIIGSHGRHGIGLILGSTANGVLHRAQCDVLCVRLQDS